ASRLERLAAMHADEPGLEVMVASVSDDGAAAELARRVSRRPRALRGVVDATAGVRRTSRLLDQPAPVLTASFEQEVLPHLAAARHLLPLLDRKSTRLNSSHVKISYAVFCLKKKKREA